MLRYIALFVFLSVGVASASQVRVVDGDTIVWRGETVRLHGIDAPERGQRCNTQSGTWACGDAATERLAAIVANRDVTCVPLDRDSYDRIIAACHIGDVDLASDLVANGLAWAFTKYSLDYASDESDARAAGRGVWRAETEAPWEFRARRWNAAAQQAPEGCPIKGNISANGQIYHAPWSKWYSRTRINTAKGERWFCDEAEAIAAGWRAPRS